MIMHGINEVVVRMGETMPCSRYRPCLLVDLQIYDNVVRKHPATRADYQKQPGINVMSSGGIGRNKGKGGK